MRRRFLSTTLAVLAVTCSATLPNVTALTAGATAGVQSEPLNDASLEAAAISLAVEDSLSVEDARSQMLDQQRQIDLTGSAQAFLGATYGGSYIDRQTSQLVVQGTDLEQLQKWFEKAHPSRVTINTVQQPKSFFEGRLYTNVVATLNSQETPVLSAAYLAREQKLEVRVPRVSDATRQTIMRLYPEVILSQGEPAPMTCNTTLTALTCTAPIRGGIYIIGDNHGPCSAGFMVKSVSDQAPYVLTAGHCVSGGDVENFYGLRLSDGARRLIGEGHSKTYNLTLGQDSGIIHLSNTTSWGTGSAGWVYVMASSTQYNGITYTTTADESYDITNAKLTSTLPQGARLCRTGTTSGTKCGPLIGQEVGTDFFDVRVRACSGDSGGPFYVNHTAYGVLSGGINAIDGCTQPTSNQYIYAQEVIWAMADRGVELA